MIGTGAMCDPYMHCEETLRLTRRCLEIIDLYEYGVAIQTKSDRILRDLDVLERINRKAKCVVQMTLTTYDETLCKILEPNVCTTKERVKALKVLHEHNIPTVVWLSPILPFINDTRENIEGILSCCIQAKVYGIICFGMGVTLRDGDREYFYAALDRHFPGMKERYRKKYGHAYELPSDRNRELMALFRETCGRNGIVHDVDACFRYLQEFPQKYQQLCLIDTDGQKD